MLSFFKRKNVTENPPAMAQSASLPIPATRGQSAAASGTWFNRLRGGLAKTRGQLAGVFSGVKIDETLFEELESSLLLSDVGVAATQKLLAQLRQRIRENGCTESAQVKVALRELLIELLQPLSQGLNIDRPSPQVWLLCGVNGAGKTTTIGKLTHHLQAAEKNVLLAAGDTFRAAAREQLQAWGERNQVLVLAQENADPAAIAFDAVQAGKARGMDVVLIDTAGRLPTQLHLMEELKKIKRVLEKASTQNHLTTLAPHEVLLVIDGNTGQNALQQVKAFDAALGVSGLIVTKLDGSAKGGVLAAIACQHPIPVYYIGVGEALEDLQPFDPAAFVAAWLD